MKPKRHATAALAAILLAAFLATEAVARVGGARSFGSRGSRSYSAPARPSSPSSPSAPGASSSPSPSATASPPGPQAAPPGGFLRGLAGGIAGGFLGSLLFGGMGSGWGGGAGGGFGILEILLLGGLGYLAYRFFLGRSRSPAPASPSPAVRPVEPGAYGPPPGGPFADAGAAGPGTEDLAAGLAHIRRMDPSFDERAFRDQAMDIFFRIQGAWMNRDMAPAGDLLTGEMRAEFDREARKLAAGKRINRLENIAVRNVDVTEAWQESGQDYATVQFLASLLDYTTDESGNVVSGSKVDPVKFEEFWTFTRPVGPGEWRLSAIQQAN